MPTVSIGDATLHFERAGGGANALFIQGVGCKGCTWKPQTNVLSHNYDCVWFDNRGIGESQGETKGLSIEQMATDAIGLLDTLGIERVHVVGHSMGGVIAQQLALDHQPRVKSLTLMCTLHRGKDAASPTWQLLKNGILTNLGTRAMRERAFARMICGPEYLNQVGLTTAIAHLSAVFERDLAALPSITKRQLRALSKHDASARLSELSAIPTLIIAGRHDPIARPIFAERLAQAISGASLHIFENASHALPIEAPEAINALLNEHFASAEHLPYPPGTPATEMAVQ